MFNFINKFKKIERNKLNDRESLITSLEEEMISILAPCEKDFLIGKDVPHVVLFIGVNGAGKTTTIGKIAAKLYNKNIKVILAAGDTFRAAAIEQLEEWAKRVKCPLISQHQGSDSAAVIHDSYIAAKSRGFDVLLADTSGRLHTKEHLMKELDKITKVLKRQNQEAPQETILVLDAGIGQNAINQAEKFIATTKVTGLIITKLDGTAKGGVIFALAEKFKLPIYFIGLGESADDLQEFNAQHFVKTLLSH